MIIFGNDVFEDAEDLPIGDPYAVFMRPTIAGGYDMTSNIDFSGNGKNMKFSGSFNNFGAVMDGTQSSIIELPIQQKSDLTIIMCWKAEANSENNYIVGNMELTTPRKGFRLVKTPDSGQLNVAQKSGELVSIGTGVAGAWTQRAICINQDEVMLVTRTGSLQSAKITNGLSINESWPIYMGGIPSSLNVGSISKGFTGILGFALVYDEFISSGECVSIMSGITGVMAERGVSS